MRHRNPLLFFGHWVVYCMPSRAPIAVFGYARTAQLCRTLEQLSASRSFDEHQVHLFLDGAKGNGDQERVAAVRKMAESLHWPNLTLRRAPENRGLKHSIIDGVSELVAEHGRAIVIEDDLLCSPLALEYFSSGLDAYADDDRVKAVCGYMYKLRAPAPAHRAFFLPFASSWGWATWRRAWEPFVPEQARLLERAGDRQFQAQLDRQGIIAGSTMLQAQQQGLIDSWAILWNAYLAENDGLALFPAETMVLNGGFADVAATHASRGNPIHQILKRMNRGRILAEEFALPSAVEPDETMRRRVATSWESRLHRLAARLGYARRRVVRQAASRRGAAVSAGQ
jgi:hypothetical protein